VSAVGAAFSEPEHLCFLVQLHDVSVGLGFSTTSRLLTSVPGRCGPCGSRGPTTAPRSTQCAKRRHVPRHRPQIRGPPTHSTTVSVPQAAVAQMDRRLRSQTNRKRSRIGRVYERGTRASVAPNCVNVNSEVKWAR
jgi:hypothetical protein